MPYRIGSGRKILFCNGMPYAHQDADGTMHPFVTDGSKPIISTQTMPPIYDYECPRCGMIHEDELDPPEACDNCDYDGKPESFNRLFPSRPAAAKLTGKGFHDTDYPKNGTPL